MFRAILHQVIFCNSATHVKSDHTDPGLDQVPHVTNKLSLEGVCDLYLNTDALWLKSCFGACSGRAAVEALHIAVARIDHLVGREHRGAGEEFDAAKRMFPDFDSEGKSFYSQYLMISRSRSCLDLRPKT